MLNSNNNTQSNNKLFILKIRTQDAEKKVVPIHFEVFSKKDDKWESVRSDVRDVSGSLTRLELGEKEFNGEKSPTVKLTLEDASQQESYMLDLRYSMITRSLFNALLSLKSFDNLKISVYQTKPKSKDEKSYPQISLRQNDEKVSWKYKLEELPPVEKVTIGKKEITNFDKLNDFFVEKLRELTKSIRGKAKTQSSPTSKTQEDDGPQEPNDSQLF